MRSKSRAAIGIYWLLPAAGLAMGSAQCALAQAVESERAAADSSAAAAPITPPARTEQRLDIWEIDIDGNTVLTDEEIIDAVRPYVGPQKSRQDMIDACKALTEKYRNHGYQAVSVIFPPQKVVNGVVNLQVNQNPVGHLTVVGAEYSSVEKLKDQVPSAAEGQVLNVEQFTEEVKKLSNNDRTVTPALEIGADQKSVNIALAVEDHLPVNASVELNNKRSANTAALRSVATLGYDNLWQLEHSFSISYQTAPERLQDTQVLIANYSMPFDDRRWTLAATGIFSNSNVAAVGGINVLGKGQVASLHLSRLFALEDDAKLNLNIGADYKHFRSQTNLVSTQTSSAQVISDVPLTYVPFSIGLGYLQSFRPEGYAPSALQSDLSYTFTSAHIGSTAEDLGENRAYTHSRQSYWRGGVGYTLYLPYSIEIYEHLAGQVTDQSLISNEQFSAGGADTVRGYYESEALGDYGLNGTIELRHPIANNQLGKLWAPLKDLKLTPSVFFDTARLRLLDTEAEQINHYLLTSAGVTLGLKYRDYASGYVDFAYPIETGPFTHAGDGSVLFRIVGTF